MQRQREKHDYVESLITRCYTHAHASFPNERINFFIRRWLEGKKKKPHRTGCPNKKNDILDLILFGFSNTRDKEKQEVCQLFFLGHAVYLPLAAIDAKRQNRFRLSQNLYKICKKKHVSLISLPRLCLFPVPSRATPAGLPRLLAVEKPNRS